MATAAQIAANRRNALKSTGPRTAAGKAVSCRNALRHGMTARATVVLGEDPQDFQRFRSELTAALAPRDAREGVPCARPGGFGAPGGRRRRSSIGGQEFRRWASS
jgi:hypothetical protein